MLNHSNLFEYLSKLKDESKFIDTYNHPEFLRIIVYYYKQLLAIRRNCKLNKQLSIVVHLPTGAQAYAVIFASLLARVTFIPLNVDSPIAYNLSIIKELCPDIIVSLELNISNYHSIYLLNSIDVSSEIDSFIDHENITTYPNDLAYIIFTSGSTGKPKGVKISYDSFFHYINWCLDELPVTNRRILQTAVISFDLSVLGFIPFVLGYSSLYSLYQYRDILPTELLKIYSIDTVVSVPSFLNLLCLYGPLSSFSLTSSIVFVLCGEVLKTALASNIFSQLPDSIIWNLYGPTEATVSVSSIKLSSCNYLMHSNGSSMSIGSPIRNHRFLFESNPSSTPDSLLSENSSVMLFIEGPQVSLGYLNQPELTKQYFSLGPTAYHQYKTFDLVTTSSDSQIYFDSRADRQIKLNGYRIELGEIESKALQFGVVECCAAPCSGFITLHYSSSLSVEQGELSLHLSRSLPPYYRIKLIRHQVLPRTPNGKLDYSAMMDYHDASG